MTPATGACSIVDAKAIQESLVVMKDSIYGAKVVAGKASMIVSGGNLNIKVKSDFGETNAADSMEDIHVIPSSEKDLISTAKDSISNATSETLDEQTQVTVIGKVVLMDTKEITCPNFEGLDTDDFNENFCFSVEELQAPLETVSGRTENHYDAFANMQSSQQPSEVVNEGGVSASNNKVLLNCREDRNLLIEECSHQSTTHDSALLHYIVEGEMGIDYETCIYEGGEPPGEDLELKVEKNLERSASDNAQVNSKVGLMMDSHVTAGQEIILSKRCSYNISKLNLSDTMNVVKKESMCELTGGSHDFANDRFGDCLVSSSGRKRKLPDPCGEDSSVLKVRKTMSPAIVSTTTLPLPKRCTRIGECINRVASQMNGYPSIMKVATQQQDGRSDGLVEERSDISFQCIEDAEVRRMAVPTQHSSLELLMQLTEAAQEPLRGNSSLTVIVNFFSNFRNLVIMEQHDKVGGKTRPSVGSSLEAFEFEDMGDTYWTDRVIQNGSEEQVSSRSTNLDNVFVPVLLNKSSNKLNARKRYSDGNNGESDEKPAGYVDEKTPAELVMHFPVVDSVPTEISLNKMFRHFGPLKELETIVDKDTNRARVVFKKCCDAEAAYGSAPKFNIFGSVLVNYQLNYTISVPFKSEPVATLQEEDATLFLQY